MFSLYECYRFRLNTNWPCIKAPLKFSFQDKEKLHKKKKQCCAPGKIDTELLHFCCSINIIVFVITSYFYIVIKLQYFFNTLICFRYVYLARKIDERLALYEMSPFHELKYHDVSNATIGHGTPLPNLLAFSIKRGIRSAEIIQVLVPNCIFSFRLQPGASCSPWP